MKIKSMVKFSLFYLIKGYVCVFLVIFLLINLSMVLTATNVIGSGIMGGMDIATIIFLLIVGGTSYKGDIAMAIQNGVSRKSYFCSTAILFVILALIASTGDTILSIIGNFYQTFDNGMGYDSMYEQTFLTTSSGASPIPTVIDYFRAFFVQCAIDIFALASGFLIGTAIYRLPKVLKVIIPAIFYTIIFIVFPILDYSFFDSKITRKLFDFGLWILESSWNMSLTFVIGGIVLLGISFPFIRRVSISDRK